MNRITFFLNNNSVLFFSWYCSLFYIDIKETLYSRLGLDFIQSYFILCFNYLFAIFVIFSIFYSFYQSIRNIKINKKYAFALLIFYLVAWMFFSYDLINDGVNEISVTKFSIFILIHVCFCLYNLFKKKDITLIICLMFYGSNAILFYFLITIQNKYIS